jgi:hypothetical protein
VDGDTTVTCSEKLLDQQGNATAAPGQQPQFLPSGHLTRDVRRHGSHILLRQGAEVNAQCQRLPERVAELAELRDRQWPFVPHRDHETPGTPADLAD